MIGPASYLRKERPSARSNLHPRLPGLSAVRKGKRRCLSIMAEKADKKYDDPERKGQPVRLYQKGAFIGFTSSLAKQRPGHAMIKIDGVNCKEDTAFYLGKRVAFIYKAKRKQTKARGKESNYRCIWGRVRRAHGSNGVTICRFRRNLPPKAMGATVRIMMYPSNI
eukprot:g68827.t1